MEALKTYRNPRLAQMGCAVLCTYYFLWLFNGLVLEALHEVSHIMGPKIHHHNFASDHEAIDYAPLEAMAGHSHEALEALKGLLEANQPNEPESKGEIGIELDKHLLEEVHFVHEKVFAMVRNNNWEYKSVNYLRHIRVSTPPPQHSGTV